MVAESIKHKGSSGYVWIFYQTCQAVRDSFVKPVIVVHSSHFERTASYSKQEVNKVVLCKIGRTRSTRRPFVK